MLERVEAEVGEAGDVVPGRVYAEDAALIARPIALAESLLIQVRMRAFLVFSGHDAQADRLPRQGSSGAGPDTPTARR
jgi:hypothetical protein